MLGSLMMFAERLAVSSPSSARASGRCCSAGRTSANCARTRPASEMSRVSTLTPAALVKASTTGRNERVASAGASSVRVQRILGSSCACCGTRAPCVVVEVLRPGPSRAVSARRPTPPRAHGPGRREGIEVPLRCSAVPGPPGPSADAPHAGGHLADADVARTPAGSPVRRLLAVTAHPDDAELLAGGVVAAHVAAGVAVSLLVLTDGDAGAAAAPDGAGRPPPDLGAVRRAEQRSASAALGVRDVRFAGGPDGALRGDGAARAAVVDALHDVRPDRLLTLSPVVDPGHLSAGHPDHRAAGTAALDAVLLGADPAPRPAQVWLVAHPRPTHAVDVEAVLPAVVAAARLHASQLDPAAPQGALGARLRARRLRWAAAAGRPDRAVEGVRVVDLRRV